MDNSWYLKSVLIQPLINNTLSLLEQLSDNRMRLTKLPIHPNNAGKDQVVWVWIHKKSDWCSRSSLKCWALITPPTQNPLQIHTQPLHAGVQAAGGRGGRLLQDSWVHKNKSPWPAVTLRNLPPPPHPWLTVNRLPLTMQTNGGVSKFIRTHTRLRFNYMGESLNARWLQGRVVRAEMHYGSRGER